MAESHFQKVFTRQMSSANVTTAKAEEKRLEDDRSWFLRGELFIFDWEPISLV